MALLTTILQLLDQADCGGYELDPKSIDITVDGDAFWREMEREGLKASEPRTAFGFNVILKAGYGKVEIDGFHEHLAYSSPMSEWENGGETFRQAIWRQYKTLPQDMKDDRWPNLIHAADTLKQISDLSSRIEAMWRIGLRRRAVGIF
jgi:hypothetical protein